jgi:hypothetical protein
MERTVRAQNKIQYEEIQTRTESNNNSTLMGGNISSISRIQYVTNGNTSYA